MNNTLRVEIKTKAPLVPDTYGQAILSEIRDFGIKNIQKVETLKVYSVEGLEDIKEKQILKSELFMEPLWLEEEKINTFSHSGKSAYILEISLKPGVTNTEIDSITMAAKDLGFRITSAESRRKFILWGNPSNKEIEIITDKLLMNKTIEEVINGEKHRPKASTKGRWAFGPDRPLDEKVEVIPIRKSNDKQLTDLSKKRLLNLSVLEMRAIKRYFIKEKRDPTDCELETLAQTWSEHCFHKTFKAKIKIKDKIKSSFMDRIMGTTRKINHRDCLVTFSDNAGIVSFTKDYAFCAKTETHNSPCALEPYGGAMTGSGGVFRDIAATGLGAKNVAASDIFCFGDPNMGINDVPDGCLVPKRIMQKCVAGVRDYGNRLGVPTINGSMTFDRDFRAKPVVLVGGFGVIPKKYVYKKKLKTGDLVVTIGGKTGRDGMHGATFSSGQMTHESENLASSSVQIGNPIEEKKMFDALLWVRDEGIIKNIADCGGGGYSSSIGEMGKNLGVWIDLASVSLKYTGLSPWEIWLSESQERMIVAIDKKNLGELAKICELYSTSFTVLGHFTGEKRLELVYDGRIVADLSMDFLFEGIPQRVLGGEHKKKSEIRNPCLRRQAKSEIIKSKNFNAIFKKILANLNVASKEEVVRRYDHEVQGRLVLKPFVGVNFDGPQDGAVVKPLFDKKDGLAFSHGLAVGIAKIDPYWGAVYAVDEAIRNQVAMGVGPDQIFLLDNFIFPKPNKQVLGDLDLAVDGICDAASNFQTPFISGKDSLSGTYTNKNFTIKVPPTIIVSAVGKVADITKTISSDFKTAGNKVYLIGKIQRGLGGSIYEKELGIYSESIPQLDLKLAKKIYQQIHQAMQRQFIVSCHDISEGGMLVTFAEMCFGGDLGVNIMFDTVKNIGLTLEELLFSESGARFIVEVEKKYANRFESLLEGIPSYLIGEVKLLRNLKVNYQKKIIINESIKELKNIWQMPFIKYF